MSKERTPQHEHAPPPSRVDRVVSTITARTKTLCDIVLSHMGNVELAPGERDMRSLIDAQEKLRGVMLRAPYARELYLVDPALRALLRAQDPHLAQFLSHTFSISAAAQLIRYGAESSIRRQDLAEPSHDAHQGLKIDLDWLKSTTPQPVIDEILRQQAAGHVHLLGVGAALYGAHRQLLLSAEGGAEGVPMWRLPAHGVTSILQRPGAVDIEAQIAAPVPTQLTNILLTVGPQQPPPPPGSRHGERSRIRNVPAWQISTTQDELYPTEQTIIVSGENTAQMLRGEPAAHMEVVIIGHEGLRSALAAQTQAYSTITTPTFEACDEKLTVKKRLSKLTHMMDHIDVRTAQIMYAAMRENGEGLGVEVYNVPGLSELRAKISKCTAS